MSAQEPISFEEAFGSPATEPVTETAPVETGAAPAGDEPAVPPSDPNEQQAVSQDNDTPAEPEMPEWKRYGFKDENAMWKSYKELQAEYTRVKQPAPAEEEPTEEPLPTWTDHNFEALGEIPRVGLSAPQRQQLSDLMQVDPRGAALWARQNEQFMEPQDFKAVQNNWAQSDPEEYWEFKQALADYQREQQRTESEHSQREWVVTQQREAAVQSAKQALPLMDTESEAFGEWLDQPENQAVSQMLDQITDPARLQQALVSAFYQYAGPSIYQQLVTSHQQVAQAEQERISAEEAAAAAAATKGRNARTQTRTAATTTATSENDADDALRQAILQPRGG